MNWISAYLKRPHAITALILLGVSFGFISFNSLPLNLFPDANYPQVSILLLWPGASAEDMADKISRLVEKEMKTLDKSRTIKSTVRDETAAVKVEFDYAKSLDAAVTDVNAALNRIMPSLPFQMLPPRIFRVSDAIAPVQTLAVYPKLGSHLDMPKVRQLCDNEIQEAFLRIPGIADVEIFGGYMPEVLLNIDRDRLARFGFTIEKVINAIASQNRNIPSGLMIRQADERMIKIQGEEVWRHELATIIIGNDSAGNAVYVKDIAGTTISHQQRRTFFHGNGQPAIGLNILRAEDGHVTTTLSALKKAMPDIRMAFPELVFEVVDTQGELINTSVSNLLTSLRDSVILTVAVIFLIIARIRTTLLAAISIPFTFLLTFASMKIINYELNIVTMTAIILAVGLLVDDAIVVIENIDRHAAPGDKSLFQSSVDGTREIFLADFAGTATTLSVLIPIMFVGGYSQKILRPLTVVLSLALLASYIVSVTVIPLLAPKLMKPGHQANRFETGLQKICDFWITPLQNLFIHIFRVAASKWGLIIFPVIVVLLFVSLRQMPLAGRDLMPAMDTGIVKIEFEAWPNSNIEQTEKAVAVMENFIKQMPGFVRMATIVGAEPNVISFGADRTSQEGLMTVHFKNRFERDQSIWEIEADLRNRFQKMPGLKRVSVFDYGATPLSSIAAPIDVMISGPDPKILDRLAEKVKAKLYQVRGLTSVSRSWDWSKREIAIDLNQEKMSRYGITANDVSQTIMAATTGTVASHFRIAGEDGYGIRLRFDQNTMQSMNDLSVLQIPGPSGNIPLKEIATIRNVWRQSKITRQNLMPVVDLFGYRDKTAITHLQDQVSQLLSDIAMPAGYTLTQEGEIRQMTESFGNLGRSMALALIFLYFSLVITFKSYLNPLIIMSAIPLAFLGVPWGMLLLERHFCMPAAMGMILLAGIVVNNSILLVDFVETTREQGTDVKIALEDAIRRRARPILMTALSTTAGMLPIAAEMAVGLERLSPLAVAAIAGLLVATFLTLAYVPVIYWFIDRFITSKLKKGMI